MTCGFVALERGRVTPARSGATGTCAGIHVSRFKRSAFHEVELNMADGYVYGPAAKLDFDILLSAVATRP